MIYHYVEQLSINVLLIEHLEKMHGHSMIMKDMVTKKRSVSFEDDDRMQHYSAISTRSLMQKKEDPGAFTILCTVGLLHFTKPLCDLSASINLMPLSIYKKLGLCDLKPNAMWLLMVDRTVKKPIEILHDVLVKVESFIFPYDFLILESEVDFEVPIILGKPLLSTGYALVETEKGQMKFSFNNEEAIFNICRCMKHSGELQTIFSTSYRVENMYKLQIEEYLGVKALAAVIMNLQVMILKSMNLWLRQLNEMKICPNQ